MGILSFLGCLTASAVTVDDLMKDNGWGVEILRANDFYGDQNWVSGGIKFERVEGQPDKIKLTNFMDEDPGLDFIFTLSGDKLLLADWSSASNNPKYQIRPAKKQSANNPYVPTYGNWEGTITYNPEFEGYTISFGRFALIYDGNTIYGYEDADPALHYYNSLTIYTYKSNVIVTDEAWDDQSDSFDTLEKERYYHARIMVKDGNAYILNFSNDGYGLTTNGTPQLIKLDYYSDGDFGINYTRAGAGVRGPDINSYAEWTGIYLNYVYVGHDNRYDFGEEFYATPEPYVGHVPTHNHWAHHVNGGTLETISGDLLPWDDYTTYNLNYKFWNYAIKNTKMYWGDIITPEIQIEMDDAGYAVNSEDGLYVSGTIKPVNIHPEVEQYIDHYELYVADEAHSTVSNKATNNETGLSRGFNIHNEEFEVGYEQEKSRAAATAGPTDEIKFQKLIRPENLPADFNYNPGHTLFVKTYYKAGSGLTPSFHALTPLNNTTTGIDEIAPADNVSVVAGEGVIKVSGAEGTVEVYNAAGVQVYAGTDNEIAVAAGLYIVKAGNKATKVVVR